MGFRPFFILFIASLAQTLSFHNPGIIIQVPTPYELPNIDLALPVHIAPIIVQRLELNQITLRNIAYNWRYANDTFIINLERTQIYFNWKFNHDSGLGSFIQEYTDLKIKCYFAMDSASRFTIDVDNAQITNDNKKHSIKIYLGGNVPETVAVEVTNLILNHAKFAFHNVIKKTIVSIVEDLTKPLREDVKIVCRGTEQREHCVYVNTTLVGKPILSESKQIIQINGAPYLGKHESGYLDPSQAMFKVNSSQVNAQIHQQVVNRVAGLLNQIEPINFTVVSTEISSVTDIDSQTLSILFPKMKDYDPRPVILRLFVHNITAVLDLAACLSFRINATLQVSTQKPNKDIVPYLERVQGQAIVRLDAVSQPANISLRINKVDIVSLKFEQADIANNLVNPPEIAKHLPALMQWAEGGINGDLNGQIKQTQFLGLPMWVKPQPLNHSLNVQIVFPHKNACNSESTLTPE